MQLDIKAVYFNAPLDKDIYVTIPPGDVNFGKRILASKKSFIWLETIRSSMEHPLYKPSQK